LPDPDEARDGRKRALPVVPSQQNELEIGRTDVRLARIAFFLCGLTFDE
jgi:hypothetical protein